ncbi:MAG TPA: retropepsin-like aspartic protease [Rhizomicrobium sp.]|nr:retropepsin-like aspartic protease [Rhizomicrobium sp.]
MRVGSTLGSLALAILFQNTAALAEDCGPLKQIASLDMVPGPGASFLVPASINGTPQQMLLNTAGGITSLRQDAVERLGLHSIDASHIKLLSSNGNTSQSYVQVDFAMGAIHAPNLQAIVMPGQANGPAPFAGNLAGDFLSLYDVEMDFAGRKLNFFSKDHCPGHVIYWKADALAVLPIALQTPTRDDGRWGFRPYSYRGSHINVPVSINGKDFKAAINTSTPVSAMTINTAKFIFGVTAESPGAEVLNSPDGNPEHRPFRYTFATMTFDTVTVTNPKFIIYPDLTGAKDPNNGARTDNRARHVDDSIGGDISIGMDVLRKLHIYVAYGENKLYITPAAAPQPKAAATQ